METMSDMVCEERERQQGDDKMGVDPVMAGVAQSSDQRRPKQRV
jgi:hypothetical protein